MNKLAWTTTKLNDGWYWYFENGNKFGPFETEELAEDEMYEVLAQYTH